MVVVNCIPLPVVQEITLALCGCFSERSTCNSKYFEICGYKCSISTLYDILHLFCIVWQRRLNAGSELRGFCAVRTWGRSEGTTAESILHHCSAIHVLPCDPVANLENNELRLFILNYFAKLEKKKKIYDINGLFQSKFWEVFFRLTSL